MSQKRAERVVIISGKDGYVQITDSEKTAFRIEVYFSATNVGENNYYSYEWYKKRTLYGRFKVARGEYTSKEKLVQYQNELIHSEEALLFELVKRQQCEALYRYTSLTYIAEYVQAIAQHFNITLDGDEEPVGFVITPPDQVSIPGLQMDGVYYNMMPGCAGELTFQTWYDDDECLDPENGDPLTRDNRGDPPDPASSGEPLAGDESDVPEPTYPPGSTYDDPTPGADEPTEEGENPLPEDGFPGTLYTLTGRDFFSRTGVTRGLINITIVGSYTSVFRRPINNGASIETGILTSLNRPGQPALFVQLLQSGVESDGVETVTFELGSITPQ